MQIQMFELQRLGREKEHLLEEKRQLRDEKLLLLMSKMPAAVGSASISRMVSNEAQHTHISNGSSCRKHPRDGDAACVTSGVYAWNLVSPLTSRRMGPAAAALRVGNDTHVIITGGYNGDVDENVSTCLPPQAAMQSDDEQVSTCEALLSTGRVSPLRIGDMLVARAWHCAVACGDCLYVMGGADNAQRYLSSTERCSMQDLKWTPCAPMSYPRYGFAAVTLNGFIYCIGGYDGETWLDSVARYSPQRCTRFCCLQHVV